MRLNFIEFAGFRSAREKVRVEFGTGVTVITGRNGVGKSSVLDAVDFALTGSINKYRIESAKGGGLAEHIWWVGEGVPEESFVKLSVVDDEGSTYAITRFKNGSLEQDTSFQDLLVAESGSQKISLRKLSDTTILRDELISELSLDLSERDRFQQVLEAIAPMTGPDLSQKVSEVTRLASGRTSKAQQRRQDLQSRLAQVLEELASARNDASKSSDSAAGAESLQRFFPNLPIPPDARRELVVERISAWRLSGSIVADLQPRLQALAAEMRSIEVEGLRSTLEDLRKQLDACAAAFLDAQREAEAKKSELDAAQRENAALGHLALLVQHGEALGLHDGHCPLCDAARTQAEFHSAIEESKKRLADAGNRVATANTALLAAIENQNAAEDSMREVAERKVSAERRIQAAERERELLSEVLTQNGCAVDPNDVKGIEQWVLDITDRGARAQEALLAVDSSEVEQRIAGLETTAEKLRSQIDSLSGEISARENVADLAKKMENLTKAFPNEILVEQFDTVMPLLKEFYRRLRPHTDWNEIEYDFGGRIRATLNFYVADNKNPQFLFSSGQRRATGLAFLLAVHLARHWAKLKSLILDDPVQHIDDYRALNLVEVLSAVRRTGHQVVVAVEDASLARLLARRLRVTPEQPGRFYELGTAPGGNTCIREDYALPPLASEALRQPIAS